MSDIAHNIEFIKTKLPTGVKLIAVSKTKPDDLILEAYRAGHRVFGENKVQELVSKYESLPKDIEWHMIGHLQSNKVKFIAPFISLIHAVDSFKLLQIINDEAQKNNRTINCLLQLKIAREESKFGLSFDEAFKLVAGAGELKHIKIVGLMGMATFTDNELLVREEFKKLSLFFLQLKSEFFRDKPYFSEISMGMSDDYQIAVEEGSTMVRIGSSIFGKRIYN